MSVNHNEYFYVSNMVQDNEEEARKIGDRVSNQKRKWDSTYIRQQNILARINGVQNDYISSHGGREGQDFEKVDWCALIDKEDKGEKVPDLKRRNGVLPSDSWEYQSCSVESEQIKLTRVEICVEDSQKLGCTANWSAGI